MDSKLTAETNKSIKKITVEFDDGSTRIVKKGFIADIRPDGNSDIVTFDLMNIGQKEISEVVYAVAEFGMQLGLFD